MFSRRGQGSFQSNGQRQAEKLGTGGVFSYVPWHRQSVSLRKAFLLLYTMFKLLQFPFPYRIPHTKERKESWRRDREEG